MSLKNECHTRLQVLEGLFIVAIYPLSIVLPQYLSWENGFLENSQVVILLLAMLLNLYFYNQQKAKLHLTFSVFFFTIACRELNWGRCLFPINASDSASKGPIFIPMSQFPHHTAIGIGIAVLTLCILFGAIFTPPWKRIIRQRLFPIKLIFYCAICTVLSFLGDSSHVFADSQSDLIEELSECLLYLLLLHISVYYYYVLNQSDT